MTLSLPSTDFGVDIPFVRHLGFVLTVFADGQSEVSFAPQPEHLNSYQVTHGGVVMTLLDVTMAMAARAAPGRTGVVTVEMKTSFMRPSQGALTARGTLKHHTATLAFTEATVYDAHGQACAHATGTFKYIKRLPVGSKTVHGFNSALAQSDA
ncbi:PaaI family thioesterase [Rhodoferax fermentans]|uniref:Medium/long-chain acyl-CoA thioesterase YigI n=1 Tax=Rhodoferax fermentans TaxID=28066 RepID=A0A1T1APD7_RHOFE|nr:PaaI family thioesterase [Rhodoferax fermentans]MBK1683361.1 PaaI family thioesterase [Rhodoferax fermentans]OOV05887.1 phenylacetic acid degradation protein [Rhodoferax fermentans]